MRKRIVFMGSPEFAIPALVRLSRAHDIVAVYTQPPRPAGRGMKEHLVPLAQYAQQLALPVHWPQSLKSADAQDKLAALNADVLVVVAYGLLLPQLVLDIPRYGCINGPPTRIQSMIPPLRFVTSSNPASTIRVPACALRCPTLQ